MSAAASPDPPAPPETPPAGITREEFEQLQARLEEFQQAADRLAEADTAGEERRREAEAREAAARVEQTANRIGLSPADVGEIRGWIRSETKEAVREALDEIAEVRRTDDPGESDGGGGAGPAATLADLSDDPTRPPVTPASDPPAPPAATAPPETPPAREHWFHRPLGGQSGDGDGAE